MRRLISILAIFCAGAFAFAQNMTSFRDVRRMIDDGVTEVSEDIFIEGWCIINGGWGNIAANTPRYHNSTTAYGNNHTAYIQNADASLGFCVRSLSSKTFRKLGMGDRLRINLNGTVLEKTPEGIYVINGLEQSNLLDVDRQGPGVLPGKVRRISDLSEEDLCTFVTVPSCEFVFKDGAWINIYETYAQKNAWNGPSSPNESMDGWASLLCDGSGASLYTVINTGAGWRRNKALPQGSGTVSGTLVHDPMPRYSAFDTGYQIRCMNETFYKLTEPSAWRSIAEWTWNNGRPEFETETGARKSAGSFGILPDSGNGLLRCEVPGTITRGDDYNNPNLEKTESFKSRGEKGKVLNGALRITTPACNWWDWERNVGRGIVAEFSTEGISGNALMFAFTFGAGDLNPNTTVLFPCYWTVQYTVDGKRWKNACDEEICCRSIPWYWGRKIKGHDYRLSFEAGLGYTDHMVLLPSECFGKPLVKVRVIPSRRNGSTYSVSASDKAAITKGLKKTTIMNFGSIAVRYN